MLPMLAANQAGHLIRVLGLPDTPTCVRLFGTNKTIVPFILGPVLAATVLFFYRDPHFATEGIIFGLGVVIGEHTKSLCKRLVGMKEGHPFPLDRVDWAIGGSIAAWLYFPWVSIDHCLVIVGIAYPLHMVGNKFSHVMGWRDTPH